jgi:hypothetical protein
MKRFAILLFVLSITAISLYGQMKKFKDEVKNTSKDTSGVADSLLVDSLLADTLKTEKLRIDTVVNLDTIVMSDTLLKTLKGYVSSSSIEGSPVLLE